MELNLNQGEESKLVFVRTSKYLYCFRLDLTICLISNRNELKVG